MQSLRTTQLGFTIVEMIVAVAIFSIVAVVSVGALLVLIGSNDQLQEEQSIMTSLSFALDSMTREIRTGVSYYCYGVNRNNNSNNNIFNSSNDLDTILSTSQAQDCSTGYDFPSDKGFQGIAFLEGGESITGSGGRILYFYEKSNTPGLPSKLYRRVGAGPWQSLLSDDIDVTHAEFFVSGTDTTDDTEQPTVRIYIRAKDLKGSDKEYELQTTVTQRTLDL